MVGSQLNSQDASAPTSKWRRKLRDELEAQREYAEISDKELVELVCSRQITSTNFDTVMALDWPHFCAAATEGCGGRKGWCYTFQGRQSSSNHNRKVAFVDLAARRVPGAFAEKVTKEVDDAVTRGDLPYPNLRYSGSGEVAAHHLPALARVVDKGVVLWGFTRMLKIAEKLREIGAHVLISCDRTSDAKLFGRAKELGFQLAYTSIDVGDTPPAEAAVTFPLHRSGKVREVVDATSLCPKVVQEYLSGFRAEGSCQKMCHRCHAPGKGFEKEIC